MIHSMGSNGKVGRFGVFLLAACVAAVVSACSSEEPVQAESTPDTTASTSEASPMDGPAMSEPPASSTEEPGISYNEETQRGTCVDSVAVTLGPSAGKNRFINVTSEWGEQYLEMETAQPLHLVGFIAGDDSAVAIDKSDGKLVPEGSPVNVTIDNFVDPENPSVGITEFKWLTACVVLAQQA